MQISVITLNELVDIEKITNTNNAESTDTRHRTKISAGSLSGACNVITHTNAARSFQVVCEFLQEFRISMS